MLGTISPAGPFCPHLLHPPARSTILLPASALASRLTAPVLRGTLALTASSSATSASLSRQPSAPAISSTETSQAVRSQPERNKDHGCHGEPAHPPGGGGQSPGKLKGNKASVGQRSVVQPPAQRPRNLLHLKGAGKEEVLLSACHSPTRKRSTASTLSVQAEKLASTSSLSAELSRQACPLETHTQCLPA